MCNCASNLVEQLYETGYEDIEAPVELLSGRLYLVFSARKKGKKGIKKIPMVLSNCPICGKKYDSEEVQDETVH